MLSLIVSVLNSHEVVRRQLVWLNHVLDSECELILLDDGSDPPLQDTVDLVEKNYDFRLIATGNFDPWTQPAARNLGAREAKYEKLLFFDIDHIITKEAIEIAKRSEALTLFYRHQGSLDENANLCYVKEVKDSYHINTFAVDKAKFLEINGYDESFCGKYGGDDVDFMKRYKGERIIEGVIYCINNTPHGASMNFHSLNRDIPAPVMVYSALLGQRGMVHQKAIEELRHIMYTDQNIEPNHNGWEIYRVESLSGSKYDPRRTAKVFKFHPERYCSSEVRIWVDANVILTQGFLDIDFGDYDLWFFQHYGRDCTYEEAKICIELGRDEQPVIEAQMERYEAEGFPKNFGLPECNVIVSRDTPKTREFFQVWEEEVEKGSVRDQLSVAYALWKTQPNYKIANLDVENGKRQMKYRLCYSHVQVRDNKELFVLMTPLHNPDPQWLMSHHVLEQHLRKRFYLQVIFGHDSAYIHKLYNQMWGATEGQRVDTKPFDALPHLKDYAWAFVMENDMIVTPEQLDKLLWRNVDVVSGVYVLGDGKTFPHSIVNPHDDRLFASTQELPRGEDLIEVASVGQGCMLLKHGVMEMTEFPWHAPVIIQHMDDHKNITKLSFTGQDLGLCFRIRKAGFRVYVDPTVRVGHRKTVALYPGDNEKKYNAAINDVAMTLSRDYPDVAEIVLKMRKPD